MASRMHAVQSLENNCINARVEFDKQSNGFLTLL
jgi:hypothetical protein